MQHTPSSTGELDLFDLIIFLWKKRLVLLISTLGFLAVGMIAASFHTPSFRGEVKVYPQARSALTGFDTWNHLLTMANANPPTPPTDYRGFLQWQPTTDRSLEAFMVTPDDLLEKFQFGYQRGHALNDALLQHSAVFRESKFDAAETETLLNGLRTNYTMTKHEDGYFIIKFVTKNKAENQQILLATVNLISETTKQEMLKTIRSGLDAARSANKLALEKNAMEIKSFHKLYNTRKTRSLSIMHEQANVARQLGIDKPFESTETKPSSLALITAGQQSLDPFESSYFLQGYLAIERQIANIEKRSEQEVTALIEDVDWLIRQRSILQGYNLAEILRPYVDKIPLNDPEFKTVDFDLTGAKYKRQIGKLFLITIFTSVGALLSIIFLLVQFVNQKPYNAKKTV